MRRIENNIINLYLIKVSKWFMLTQPILMLYFKDTGLTTEEAFKLKAIYSVAIVALELPSGYFADVLGRRLTLIIGAICGTLGFVFYSLGHGFWFFLAAEITLGFGQSFISGADSAMMYDSLLATKREKALYKNSTDAPLPLEIFAESAAAIVGGLLAEASIRYPFYAQIGIAFIAIPAALLLVEPKLHKPDNLSRGFGDILRILKTTQRIIPCSENSILFSSFTGLGTLTMAWISQLYLEEGLHFRMPGWEPSTAILNLVVALFAVLAYRIALTTNAKNLQLLILFCIPAGFMLTGLFSGVLSLLFLLLFYMLRGVATPVLKNYINLYTASSDRAHGFFPFGVL